MCNYCHVRPATELHHCLLHRIKGRPELDHPFNLEPVCHACHQSGIVNGYEHRRAFYAQQVRRYGDEFRRWWVDLPMKVKPCYE